MRTFSATSTTISILLCELRLAPDEHESRVIWDAPPLSGVVSSAKVSVVDHAVNAAGLATSLGS
jgi:hypothetical protein